MDGITATREIKQRLPDVGVLVLTLYAEDYVKQAVEAGLGLSVVSLHTVQAELAAQTLCVLDVQGFPLNRQWYLVQRQGKRLSPAAQAFARFVLSEAKRVATIARP